MDPAALQVVHHVLEARKEGLADTVSLPGADLRGAQLLRADLVGADFSGAGLDHAQLAGAKLGRANLQATLLRWADLAGADLTDADLRNADLSWARVEGVSFAGADLRGSAIEGLVGEPNTIAGARIDSEMAHRSSLGDSDVIQLWRAGAIIDDLGAFESRVVRSACAKHREDPISEIGPSDREVIDLEVTLRRQQAEQESRVPPSHEVSRAVTEMGGGAPLSVRSMKLVVPELTPEISTAPGWSEGDELLGVKLTTMLGTGNAGVVWRGVDADGEDVAVKLFDTSRSTVGLTLPAYRRGVTVMNRLTADSASVGVIELRCVSLNKLGMVMDFAENGSAADLPALQWDVKSVVTFFKQLCDIVARAHDAGALHRCIKPSNILLDSDLNPMLTDFDMIDLPALASDAGPDAGGYGPYAAPEELLGQGTQSPTADIYSLGRVLCFLLSGHDPEEGAADVPQLKELATQPAGLSRIVRKCTMRAAEARYQWVSELRDDVENYEDYENVGLPGELEANYLPYRVSSLHHKTLWLKGGRDPSDRPDAEERRGRRRRSTEPPPALKPLGISRNSEKALGALGAVLVLVSLLVVELADSAPAHAQLTGYQYLSTAGGGLMTLLLGNAKKHARLWRLLWIAVGLAAFYFLNMPALFV